MLTFEGITYCACVSDPLVCAGLKKTQLVLTIYFLQKKYHTRKKDWEELKCPLGLPPTRTTHRTHNLMGLSSESRSAQNS